MADNHGWRQQGYAADKNLSSKIFMIMAHSRMAPSTRQPLNRQGVQRITGERNIRIATANVGSMYGRSGEIVEMLERRRNDACCVQETQFKGSGCKFIGEGAERYKFWWSGEETGTRGVGILVKDIFVENVLKVERMVSEL